MDYQDYLRVRDHPLWDKNGTEALYVRKLGRTPDESYETYHPRPPEVPANIAICLIHQDNYLLDQQRRRSRRGWPPGFHQWNLPLRATHLVVHKWLGDGDGRSYLTELLQGTDPLATDAANPLRFALSCGPSALSFSRRSDAAALGIGYRLESSDDLSTWSPVPVAGSVTPPGMPWERVTIPLSTGDGPRRFVRLAASAGAEWIRQSGWSWREIGAADLPLPGWRDPIPPHAFAIFRSGTGHAG